MKGEDTAPKVVLLSPNIFYDIDMHMQRERKRRKMEREREGRKKEWRKGGREGEGE